MVVAGPIRSDGCASDCTYTGSVSGLSVCGDGQIGLAEECDQAELLTGGTPASGDGDGCSASCLIEDRNRTFCRSNNTNIFNFNLGECLGSCPEGYSCRLLNEASGNNNDVSVCGNGLIEAGEECDLGGRCDDNGEYCTSNYLFNCADPWTASCIPINERGCSDRCLHTGSVYEAVDPPDVGPYQLALTLTDGEAYLQSWLTNYTPLGGPLGEGHLIVGSGLMPEEMLAVIDRWPDCGSACINSAIGAQFNRVMLADLDPLPGWDTPDWANQILNSNNIHFYECADRTCSINNDLTPGDGTRLKFSAGSDFDITEFYHEITGVVVPDSFQFDLLDGDAFYEIAGIITLKPNTIYRVLIGSDIRSIADEEDEFRHFNYDITGDAENDVYSWIFTTQPAPELCLLDEAEITPGQATLNAGGGRENRQLYFVQPRKLATDECDEQFLNAYSFDWRWDDVDIDGEDVARFLLPSETNSVPSLADHYDGCGNGRVEYGEDCDFNDPNLTEEEALLCNPITCQWQGRPGCLELDDLNCCGNSLIDSGEECEDSVNGTICSLNGLVCNDSNPCNEGTCYDYCDTLCLWRGNSGFGCTDIFTWREPAIECDPSTGVPCVGSCDPLTVCGNGIVEVDEMCDLGTEPNGDDTDGCTDSCLYDDCD
jgi:hypothetical protein